VIAGDEPQRAARLLGMLRAEAERRKAILAGTGAATLGEHLRARPSERLPRILVLLDGFTGFQTAMDDVPSGSPLEAVRALVAEGRPLGIAWLIASDRFSPGLALLASLVHRRLVLRQASEDEYAVVGVPRALYRDAHLPPGRGFTESRMEVHCAIVGADPAGSAQAAAIAELGARLRSGSAATAPEIRLLPSEVPRASLPRPETPLEAVVGIDDDRLQPVRLSLGESHLILAGPRGSGRTNALATLAASLADAQAAPALHLLAGSSHSWLPSLDVWTTVAVGSEACLEAASRIAEAARGPGAQPGLAIVVIDDGEELPAEHADLEWLVHRGREVGVRVLAGVENRAAQRAYSGWLPMVMKDRAGLLLDPDTSLDASLVGNARLPSRQGPAWPPGRAYLVRRGAVTLVQVALTESPRLSVRWP
jgi:S-DNA-T family DNA segregation ATPase FtsK/SpoIIIE